MRFGNNEITIGQQVRAMASLFPQFQYQRTRDERGRQQPTWIGILQPKDSSPAYKIKIVLPSSTGFPSVWVLSPKLPAGVPHIYTENQSLCLYYPEDRSWNRRKLVARTIVPWTAEWLYLYELWCITDQWYGDEAPHRGEK